MKKTIDLEVAAYQAEQKALIQPRLDALKADGVFIEVIATPCSHGFRDQGYAPEAVESFARMKRKFGLWGWCDVELKLSKQVAPLGAVITGSAYVGGCSYDNQDDFVYGSGMFAEMLDEAKADLFSSLVDLAKVPQK